VAPHFKSIYIIHPFSADLGEYDTNSATWTVALPAGWQVMISIEDGTQDDAWSQPVRTLTITGASILSPPHSRLPSLTKRSLISSFSNFKKITFYHRSLFNPAATQAA